MTPPTTPTHPAHPAPWRPPFLSCGRAGTPCSGRPGGVRRGRAGFTLVEMLVIFIVIGILMTITLVVAARVTNTGRDNLSRDTIRVLDSAVQTAMQSTGSKAPSQFDYVDEATNLTYNIPIVDGRWAARPSRTFRPDTDPAQPSTTLLLGAMSKDAAINDIISQIDDDYIQRTSVTAYGWEAAGNAFGAINVEGLVIKDGHDNPIRFVHPRYDGGHGEYSWWDSSSNRWSMSGAAGRPTRDTLEVRRVRPTGVADREQFSRSSRPYDPNRNDADELVGDADEGICQGEVPYFYSAGKDNDPGAREDNTYAMKPSYPIETEDQQ